MAVPNRPHYHWHYHRLGNITGTNMTEAELQSRLGNMTDMNMTKAELQSRIGNMTGTNMTETEFQSRVQDSRALLRLGRESDTNCYITYGGCDKQFFP